LKELLTVLQTRPTNNVSKHLYGVPSGSDSTQPTIPRCLN